MTDTNKIDALVAERVMGKKLRWLERVEQETTPDPSAPFGFTDNFGGSEYGADREWHVECWWDDEAWMPCASYSTDMNHAMEVLDKFRYWDIRGESGIEKPAIRVAVVNRDGSQGLGWASTLPLAICLAALRAVGVEAAE